MTTTESSSPAGSTSPAGPSSASDAHPSPSNGTPAVVGAASANTAWQLHRQGQRLWLDNITRTLVASGQLKKYIEQFAVTGLTSNPSIFDAAIRGGDAYDDAIRRSSQAGTGREEIFFELAIDDLRAAADLFLPMHEATAGEDGWVSLEVSPEIAHDAAATQKAAQRLFKQAARKNLFIKIPGTPSGLRAIEGSIAAGIPVNVTLLFSREQYLDAAQAYLRGIERRLAAGLDPKVGSVASVFVSRWDSAVAKDFPNAPRNRLGIAVATQIYHAYRKLLESTRWQDLARQGALPQRLLWASTGVKDASLPASYYVEALAAPATINTMPEKTLRSLTGRTAPSTGLAGHADDSGAILGVCARAGVDLTALARRLQDEGAASFQEAWRDVLECIDTKSHALHSS